MAIRGDATLANKISRLNVQIKQDLQRAEAKVGQINRLIADLATTGLLKQEIVLGRWRERPGSPGNGSDESSRIVQTVLLAPEGLGICEWDSETAYRQARARRKAEGAARQTFRSFDKLKPAEKTLLLPDIEPLLDELLDIADVAASKRRPGKVVEAGAFFRSLQRTR